MRSCDICGQEYEPVKPWQKRCSKQCNSVASNARARRDPRRKCCRTCLYDLPTQEFLLSHPSCIVCEELQLAKRKRCGTCKQVKHHEDFHLRTAKSGGRDSTCKACRKRLSSTESELEKKRRGKYVSRYGITYEQVQELIAAQGGKCEICHVDLTAPHVDHNHATGAVRAILCLNCNALLGHARENVQLLEGAIAYIRRYEP